MVTVFHDAMIEFDFLKLKCVFEGKKANFVLFSFA